MVANRPRKPARLALHRADTPAERDGWVHPDDLIDDRALENVDDDEFGLKDIVYEVASLCESTSVPATVALYGSWGSGKSSLANLLQSHFRNHTKIAFARFDAFKYAEVPLRRHFLSQLATQFNVKDETFSEKLYTSSRDVRLHLPRRKWLQLAAMLVVAVCVTTLLAALASLLIAVVSKGPFGPDFTKALRASVAGIALATPLVATAMALIGKTFTADVTTEAPSSEEQFESLFKVLVKKATKKTRRERLVIFIDELDRCSPPQVVSALETLRTFLEIKPCIFIVAADRQVLEHALTESARQATPIDTSNPYYSAGSAYLDKIFQYQLQLPPLLPRRLSRYAFDLIKDRQGVWAKVANRPELISVLVPTHVRSPRRVKALLNAFALFYRLALRRAAEGRIDKNVERRTSEIAKLACLRTEFPLFANDLQLYSRLPEVVLLLSEDEKADLSIFRGMSTEIDERAHAYAKEELPVAEVIAAAARHEQDDKEDGEIVDEVERSHAKQLLRYLQKTQEIASPGADLIYLESAGAAFDLPSEFAQQLEEDAIDGEKEAVAAAVGSLEPEEQQKTYRLLARLVVEALGIEARNVAQALFAAIAVRKGDLAPVADDLLTALVTYNAGYELEPGDLSGALTLSLADKGEAARTMRRTVLVRQELLTDRDLGKLALANARRLWEHMTRLGQALTSVLEDDGAGAERALADLSEQQAAELVALVTFTNEDYATGLRDFIRSAEEHDRRRLATAAFKRLIDEEDDEGWIWNAADEIIESFEPISNKPLAARILQVVRFRQVEDGPRWLDSVDIETARSIADLDEYLDEYVGVAWSHRTGGQAPPVADNDFQDVARAVGRLRGDVESREHGDLLASLSPAITAPLINARTVTYLDLWTLADAGALAQSEAGETILEDLGRTLPAPLAPSAPQAFSEHIAANAPRALAEASTVAVESFAAAVKANGSWMPQPQASIVSVELACALREKGAEVGEPKGDVLAALAEDSGEEAITALSRWAAVFEPSPFEVFDLVRSEFSDGKRVPAELRPLIAAAATRWTPEEKAELLSTIADDYREGHLHDSVIRTFTLGDADADETASVIAREYDRAGNNDERDRVLDLWQLVPPAGAKAQTKLINDVFVPLLERGRGGAEIALRHFALVQNPPTDVARDRLKRSIKASVAATPDLARRAEKLIRKAGWIKGKRKWLPW